MIAADYASEAVHEAREIDGTRKQVEVGGDLRLTPHTGSAATTVAALQVGNQSSCGSGHGIKVDGDDDQAVCVTQLA